MPNGPISPEVASRIFDALVAHASACNTGWSRRDFIQILSRQSGCREYRFQGALGFGGKFWNDSGRWRVTCYSEDETVERLKSIAVTNAALRELWDEVCAKEADDG